MTTTNDTPKRLACKRCGMAGPELNHETMLHPVCAARLQAEELPPFTVPSTIPLERVRDLITTAMEGGIGYWCSAEPVWPKGKTREDFPSCRTNDWYWHIDLPLLGETGAYVRLRDNESEDTWVFDRAAVQRGLEVMQAKYPRHWADFIGENDDATTGDVFVQCAVLGEIVFG